MSTPLSTYGHPLPVYIAKKVATSGHVADLGPLEIGIFDNKTHHVATESGNGVEFYIAAGSPHTRDKISKFYHGMLQRRESAKFYGKDILSFERVSPSRPSNEEWVIGYGGGADDNTLAFENGKEYMLKIRLFGDKVFELYNHSMEKIIPLFVGCSLPEENCDAPCEKQYVGVKTQTREWAKAIMEHPELKEFKIRAIPVFSDYSSSLSTLYDYTLTVKDDGSVESLQDVQRAYNNRNIYRKNYFRGTSVYVFPAIASSPSAFTAKGYSVNVTNCKECTSGSFVPAQDTYVVIRPLSEDSVPATVVSDVISDYSDQGEQVVLTSGVNTTTDVITVNGHGFVTGQPFVYNDGGGTSLAGLTDGTTYYAIKLTDDTFKVATSSANAFAGTAVDLTGAGNNAQSFAPVVVGELMSKTSASINVKLVKINGSAEFTAINSDSVVKIAVTPAKCTATTGGTVNWVQGKGYYTVNRTMKLTLQNEDCKDSTSVEDVLNHLSTLKSVVSVTEATGTGGCTKTFTLTQKSNPMQDEYCLSKEAPIFEDVPSFKGSVWYESGSTENYDANIKAGIRIIAPFVSQSFSDFSYDINEKYANDPVRIEVAIYQEEINPCTFEKLAKARRVKAPGYTRMSGEYVLEQYVKRNTHYFTFTDWSDSPRMREVIDNTALQQVKRDAYYYAYKLRYKESRDKQNQHQELFEPIIFIEEGDTATLASFEKAFGAITSKFNVYLKNLV